MKIFVIHRFGDKGRAQKVLKKIAGKLSIELAPIFLDSSDSDEWKQEAEFAIEQVEAAVVFDPESCAESENARWEIERATEARLEVIELRRSGGNSTGGAKLRALYELEEEFSRCFTSGNENTFELYKLMIESSESLIARRQKTNAFFITAIGSVLAIAGLLAKSGVVAAGSVGVLYGFSVVGLLLCNSWRNLVDNYGKLNKAKFDVILRLEKSLSAQVFSAEWVSLGKGLRPKKYRSFTSTEKNVPLYFGLLIVLLTLASATLQICG